MDWFVFLFGCGCMVVGSVVGSVCVYTAISPAGPPEKPVEEMERLIVWGAESFTEWLDNQVVDGETRTVTDEDMHDLAKKAVQPLSKMNDMARELGWLKNKKGGE